jgi:hypothetical protein
VNIRNFVSKLKTGYSSSGGPINFAFSRTARRHEFETERKG